MPNDKDKTKLQQYAELQPLIKKDMETVAKQVFEQYAQKYKFNLAQVPLHVHNGVDSPNIPQASITPGLRANGTITMATDGQTYRLGLTFKPTEVQFLGTAINEVAGRVDAVSIDTAGSGYTVGDILTLDDGQGCTVEVDTVNGGGGVTAITKLTNGVGYEAGEVGCTGGTGSGARFDITISAITITKRAHIIGNAQLGPTYQFQPESASSVTTGGPKQQFIQGGSSMTIDSSVNPPTVAVFTSEDYIIYAVQPGTGAVVARARVTGYDAKSVFIEAELASGWSIVGNFVVT